MRSRSKRLGLERLEDRRFLTVDAPFDPWPAAPGPPDFVASAPSRTAGVSSPSPAASAVENTGVVRVYVEQGLLTQVQGAIDTYVADLAARGYRVGVEEFSGTAAQLRSSLQGHWADDGLEGALFVGDLPSLRFTSRTSDATAETYLHDLYFMDLDGEYTLSDVTADAHTGAVEPDIYVSRITTSPLQAVTGRDEATLINDYFAKVHAYRTGQLPFADKGIVFKDDDWSGYFESGRGENGPYVSDLFMSRPYRDVDMINDVARTTKQGYLDALRTDAESMLQMIHSNVTGLMLAGAAGHEYVGAGEIVAANPRPGFYNLYNCSAADFETAGNLIGSYVYGGSYGLNAVGSTKVGGMLNYEIFYESQARGASVGQAFRDWFRAYALPFDETRTGVGGSHFYVTCFYGMVMQGDPTLQPTILPTAALVDPPSGAVVRDRELNARRTIDVAFTTEGGSGVDPATIADAAAEFTLTGAAAAGVVVAGVPEKVGDNIYRYAFTGAFRSGPVGVSFIPGSFADGRGATNAAASVAFTVQPTVSVRGVEVREGDSRTTDAAFAVTLSSRSTSAVTVRYATEDGTATAGSDYEATAGTVTFQPGETRKLVRVGIRGDGLHEADETVMLRLVEANGSAIAAGNATAVVANDDPAPVVSIGGVSLAEGNGVPSAFVFTVGLSKSSGAPVTVRYGTRDGTAVAGDDFVAAAGILTFLPGQTQLTVTVEVRGDVAYELDETFSLTLGRPQAATLARNRRTGIGRILNDDASPTMTIDDARIVTILGDTGGEGWRDVRPAATPRPAGDAHDPAAHRRADLRGLYGAREAGAAAGLSPGRRRR